MILHIYYLAYGHFQVVHPFYHLSDPGLIDILDEGIVFLPKSHISTLGGKVHSELTVQMSLVHQSPMILHLESLSQRTFGND